MARSSVRSGRQVLSARMGLALLEPTSMQGDHAVGFCPTSFVVWRQSTRKFGTGGTCRAQLLMILLVVMSTHEMKTIFQQKKVPRWACRVLRLVDPMWLKMLETDEHIFKSLTRGVCLAYGQKEGGCMYILYNRAVHYIGKASITRKSGDPGIPVRLMHHIRCVYCPSVSCAGKPRYKLLRMHLDSIGFVPVLSLDSTRKALISKVVQLQLKIPWLMDETNRDSADSVVQVWVKTNARADGLFDGDDQLSIQRKVCGNLRLLFIPLSRSCLVPNLSFQVFWVCRLLITTCTNCSSSSMNMMWAMVKDLCGCLLLKG